MNAEERARAIIGCIERAEAELERAVLLLAGRPKGMTEREHRRWIIGTMQRHQVTRLWFKAREAHKRLSRYWRPGEFR